VRLVCIAATASLFGSPLHAQDDIRIDMARLCLGTVKHVQDLGAIALAYSKRNGLPEYMYNDLDQKNADMADMLSIAGGEHAVALLSNPEFGLDVMRAKASNCALTTECDTSLMQEAIVFADYIVEACRRDATDGN
jgi:hypothetical protein